MEDKIYTIELLHKGKYESWNFEDAIVRNDVFNKVKEQFAESAITERESVDDQSIVQLSASSFWVKDDGKIAQKVPYVWFKGGQFGNILTFINEEVRKFE